MQSSTTPSHTSEGIVRDGFEPVREVFDDLCARRPDARSWLSVYWRGEEVVRLTGSLNAPECADFSGVFSASKGISGIAFARLVGEADIDLEAPVRRYWPQFAAKGKSAVTVSQLLSHQSGLVGVPGGLTIGELCDSELAAEKLAATAPRWRPGSAHGYHAVTIGVFVEELFRRVAGVSLQEYYEHEIRRPRDIDFYLGLPESLEDRYRPMVPPPDAPTRRAEPTFDSPVEDDLRHLAFHNRLITAESHMTPVLPNNVEVRRAGVSAVGGVGSAAGLARAYAAAISDVGGPALLSPEVRERVAQLQVDGPDLVTGVRTSFAVVFKKPSAYVPFGSYDAFGHTGAGGTFAYADPLYDLALGWTTSPMTGPVGEDRSAALAVSLETRRCVRHLTASGH
ncbi:beta-lactamase family protein [Streptomyces sp. NBC_00988]|uniref:serine hydrolase domain-containing protein n=1 Tax=Streptomyces sp. NBC_00988 TaxID=2903704 RepID=UPI003868E80A|nr:beta-lactamase family protein [Streptomyces sp. NBC_00988]